MSRWSAEALRIALAPGEAALLRAGQSQQLAAAERNTASVLPALDEALADPRWHGRRAEVVLSQHLVRHVVTPAPGKVLKRAEERALVSASLREIYGDAVDGWRIEVHRQPPQHGLVGAAVDAAVLQPLEDLLARHGFSEVTIQPLATIAARHLPAHPHGWWALVESGWLSLFGAAHGAFQHVAGLPIDDSWATPLPDLIERETALSGQLLPDTVWIQPVGIGLPTPTASRAHWRAIQHGPAAAGALAIAGI